MKSIDWEVFVKPFKETKTVEIKYSSLWFERCIMGHGTYASNVIPANYESQKSINFS